MNDALLIVALLALIVAVSEWLAHRGITRYLGGAVLSLVLGATAANLGLLPTGTQPVAVYDVALSHVAPLSIFLMLMEARLSALKRAGRAMLIAFGLGASATFMGVLLAFHLTAIAGSLDALAKPMAGMYVATYIGGSANFNALALHFGLPQQPALFAASNAVDNAVTTLWLIALLLIPALLHRWYRTRPASDSATSDESQATANKTINLPSLAWLVALALAGHWLSLRLTAELAALGFQIPSVLILTTLALLVAQWPRVHRLSGSQALGTYGAYLFLTVIGAHCDIAALAAMGWAGLHLLGFVSLAVLLHGLILFGLGRAFRIEPEVLAVASCANIGGASTALPIARGLKRMDLLLPGILAGTLGTALGTYAGFAAVWVLGT